MRKNAKLILAALLLFCVTTSVNAEECDYSKQVELNTEASTVKAVYEETEIDTGETLFYVDEDGIIDTSKEVPVVKKGFNVKLMNLTENIYANVVSDDGSVDDTFFYSDTDKGTVTIATIPADNIVNFKIELGSGLENCGDNSLRIINLTTPKFNEYSKSDFCNQYPDFEYCQEFTTTLDIDYADFIQAADDYKVKVDSIKQEKENKKVSNKIKNFVKENKMLIIIASILIVVGVATSVILVKRKRSRLI